MRRFLVLPYPTPPQVAHLLNDEEGERAFAAGVPSGFAAYAVPGQLTLAYRGGVVDDAPGGTWLVGWMVGADRDAGA